MSSRPEGTEDCEGWPDCGRCTPEEPGPVAVPVIANPRPGEQLLADMEAHNPLEEPW